MKFNNYDEKSWKFLKKFKEDAKPRFFSMLSTGDRFPCWWIECSICSGSMEAIFSESEKLKSAIDDNPSLFYELLNHKPGCVWMEVDRALSIYRKKEKENNSSKSRLNEEAEKKRAEIAARKENARLKREKKTREKRDRIRKIVMS